MGSRDITRLVGALALVAAVTTVLLVLRSPHRSSRVESRPSSRAASAEISARVPAGPFGSSPASHWQEAAQAVAVPRTVPRGDLSATQVSGALAAARSYVLAARTSSDVLAAHRLTGLRRRLQSDFVRDLSTRSALDQESLGATFLAPHNRLAAPVRARGAITASYAAGSAIQSPLLVVDVNVVWAYALDADYDVAPVSADVVAVHERSQFYFVEVRPGTLAAPVLGRSKVLFYDSDCGYFNEKMVGLPRVDDPDALPLSAPDVSREQAFDPNGGIPSTNTCR